MRVDATNPMLGSDADRRNQKRPNQEPTPSIDSLLDETSSKKPDLFTTPFDNSMPMLNADSLSLLHQKENAVVSSHIIQHHYTTESTDVMAERIKETA